MDEGDLEDLWTFEETIRRGRKRSMKAQQVTDDVDDDDDDDYEGWY
jgi:hypothetical protein